MRIVAAPRVRGPTVSICQTPTSPLSFLPAKENGEKKDKRQGACKDRRRSFRSSMMLMLESASAHSLHCCCTLPSQTSALFFLPVSLFESLLSLSPRTPLRSSFDLCLSCPLERERGEREGERERVKGEGKDDVAESCEQCVFMVVGESHQDKAIQMAGTEPSRLDQICCLFFSLSRMVSVPRNVDVSRWKFRSDREVACSVGWLTSPMQCSNLSCVLMFNEGFS